MNWSQQAAVLLSEMIGGLIFGRLAIPCLRKIKTGKFEYNVGDRFLKDGSEPKGGGIVIMILLVIGALVGLIFDMKAENRTLTFDTGRKTMIFVLCAAALLCILGLHEDYIKDKKIGLGMKPIFKVCCEFLISLGFLLLLHSFGESSTDVLMPFHLGYIHFGAFYYPVTAAYMTLIINIVKLHDCPNGETSCGVDGLCTVSMMIFMLGISCGISFTGTSPMAHSVAVCTMGACCGFLFWSCAPAKIYQGESGALVFGGLAGMTVIIMRQEILFLILGTPFLVDSACALVNYLVYKKREKPLMKASTLHEHLRKCGWGDFKIIGVSSLSSLLGLALGIVFMIYAGKIM